MSEGLDLLRRLRGGGVQCDHDQQQRIQQKFGSSLQYQKFKAALSEYGVPIHGLGSHEETLGKGRQMTPSISLFRAFPVGIGLLIVTSGTSLAFNPFICCRSGPTVAEAVSQIPPIQAGMARVWFLRQFEPSESIATPMISANGVPVWISQPGTAFIRDFLPGAYTFTVPSYGVDSGQAATVQLVAGTQTYLEVQSLRSWADRGDTAQRDTLYVWAISAYWAQKYFPAMTYLGQGRST